MLAPLVKKLGPSATDMIRADHTRVVAAFHRYKADSSPARKQAIASLICTSRAMPGGALAMVGGLLAGVWLLRKVRG